MDYSLFRRLTELSCFFCARFLFLVFENRLAYFWKRSKIKREFTVFLPHFELFDFSHYFDATKSSSIPQKEEARCSELAKRSCSLASRCHALFTQRWNPCLTGAVSCDNNSVLYLANHSFNALLCSVGICTKVGR